jgi:NTE family protein
VNAYAILDGGGVKGAALAGCLKAADDNGVHFKGYGGTSAGSIIALLAAAGYTPRELQSIVTEEIEFTSFLDDEGELLAELTELPEILKSKWKLPFRLVNHWGLLKMLHSDFGLYEADKLKRFLLGKLQKKIPALEKAPDVTFQDLLDQGCPPLKIMVSDIGRQTPTVYSGVSPRDTNGSVLEAVRASMSYPFVFKPVKVFDRRLVDGGLCSNLPIFLFEEERRQNRLPVVAFDLVLSPDTSARTWSFGNFCGRMLSTALEAGDQLMRKAVEGLYYIPITVPAGINTLDFSIDETKRAALFDRGYREASTYFHTSLPQWKQARNKIEALQALRIPPRLVTPVLKAFADEIERNTPARDIRTHIMLPTPDQTRIIVYQYGMDKDPDIDFELPLDGGRTGYAWATRSPVIASIEDSAESTVNMTQEQRNKVRRDRKSLCAVPIFSVQKAGAIQDLELIGLLSVDTSTALDAALWLTSKKEFLVNSAQSWADILAKLIG